MTSIDHGHLLNMLDSLPDLLSMAEEEARATGGDSLKIQERRAEEYRRRGVPFIVSTPQEDLDESNPGEAETETVVYRLENPREKPGSPLRWAELDSDTVHAVRAHDGEFPAHVAAFLGRIELTLNVKRLLFILDNLPDLLEMAMSEAEETHEDAMAIQERMAEEHREEHCLFKRTVPCLSLAVCPHCGWVDLMAHTELENPMVSEDSPLRHAFLGKDDIHMAQEHGVALPVSAAAFLQSIAWDEDMGRPWGTTGRTLYQPARSSAGMRPAGPGGSVVHVRQQRRPFPEPTA
jgi:hypothetical protein